MDHVWTRVVSAATVSLTAAAIIAASASAGHADSGLTHGGRTIGLDRLTTSAPMPQLLRDASYQARTNTSLGSALSGIMIDPTTGVVMWRHNDTIARMPASTQKILTAYTALRSLGANHRLTTSLSQSPTNPTWVYLVGGGDPTLTPARIQAMAFTSATALKNAGRTSIELVVDTTILPPPSTAIGWKSSYVGSDVQSVQGLPLANYRGTDAAGAVTSLTRAYLASAGINVTTTRLGSTQEDLLLLGSTSSAPVSSLLATMLSNSDNDIAEHLFRLSAVGRDLPGTWQNAVANQNQLLAQAGIPTSGLVVYDGSGLSRSNRMPPLTLAQTLAALWKNPADSQVVFAWGAMPRGGQTGTLSTRFTSGYQACAKGKVVAKTGTLSDAVSLAGVVNGTDKHTRVFVLLDNGKTAITSVRTAIDTLATTMTACHY